MLDTFYIIWGYFVNFAYTMVSALQGVILDTTSKTISDIIINIRIFSDAPILTINLFDLLVYLTICFMVVLFYKLIKKMVMLPFNLLRSSI